jgi:hypothetical protein
MKFNWGTGILVFLILFLMGSVGFIIFASRQYVNLVHKDYYEKGVDYSEQMKVDERSQPFIRSINISSTNEILLVTIEESLASKIDSGIMHLYRPSDSKKDIKVRIDARTQNMQFRKEDLIHGRYILKFSWYSKGVRFEVDHPVNVR